MYKTIGVLAHVDAGKTTFSEQILYHAKTIKQRGRVDHRDAFLDNHDIEKQRGITVFADQAMFTFRESEYYLIDTPGHVDFSPEMERVIQVMDYAIVIISAVEGIQGHTETVWELLRKHQVPTFFFINKVDRIGADANAVIEDIRRDLTMNVFDATDFLTSEGDLNEEWIEFLAERDENLFDYYMENGYRKDVWLRTLKTLIDENRVFPCASGSALQDDGIEPFMKKLDQLTTTNYITEEPFAGRVYKIRHDENGTRVTYIKALSGTLNVRDELEYGDTEHQQSEKITQIRLYNGNKFKTVDHVVAGQLFAVTGLSRAAAGDGTGTIREKINYDMVPTLKSKVIFEDGVNVKEAIKYFHTINAEDPSLNAIWEEALQEVHIHVMGTIQLEVLEQLMLERFHLKVTFDQPSIVYKETIETPVIGYGHFEPLGHYAEVHLKIEPGERNSGFVFGNACHPDKLEVRYQNVIRQHLFEREHHGLLTGTSLTDVKVTLLTGAAHNKHTTGGDFREATFRALRQGLEKATNTLLEPMYQYKIKVDIDLMGRVMSDVQAAHGTAVASKIEGDKAILTGNVPVATFLSYSTELASFTHGKGTINLIFSGYQRCHNEDEVIEKIGYNKDADSEYTSTSIFCAKGRGYSVPWDQAEQEMHCL